MWDKDHLTKFTRRVYSEKMSDSIGQSNLPDLPDSTPVLDVIKKISYNHNEGLPAPKMSMDLRVLVEQHFLAEGMRKGEICKVLNISRDTLWRDEQRMAQIANKYDFSESPNVTANRLNRRFEFLYSKMVKDGDFRGAAKLELERVKVFQSLGLIYRAPERFEHDHKNRTEEEAIDAIFERIGILDPTLRGEDTPAMP